MFSRGPHHPKWRRSSHCGTSADCYSSNCVEVSVDHDGVWLRDSADTAGAVLAFPAVAWAAFVDGTKRGRFG